jgi:N-acyl-D-amino-acid deacylase
VSPGFIDGHTHMDAQVFWDELGSCSCYHGVTTVVMGHCGFSLAPAHDGEHALVVRNLERAEDISPAAMAAGIDWTWQTFPEYLDAVDGRPKAINYAANVGHSALRTWAMGERAFEQEASDEDLDTMKLELRAALAAGAVGLSTSRSPAHETSDDRPVASRLASWDEVRHLVNVMGDLGGGLFELAPEAAASSGDPKEREEWYGRLRDLTVESGNTVLLPATGGSRGAWARELIDSTAAAGGRMFGMSHSRGVSVLSSFLTRLAFDGLPEWKELRCLPLDEQLRRLHDPDVKRALVEAANRGTRRRSIGAEVPWPDYARLAVFRNPLSPNPTVAEIARDRGVDPVEAMIDLAVESDLGQLFEQSITSADPDDLLTSMKYPRSVMTFSDSGAHVSQISDCSIGTYLLGHWAREVGAFTLEEGVRMLTLVPATVWGFVDRGLVRPGFVADLNVFDPATIGPELPTVASDLPGGSKRLVQRARGFSATLVAGQVTFRDGQHSGALPGALLRGPLSGRD